MCLFMQWSYGVTCWEVFTCGKLPYAGVDPCDLQKLLERGRRLERPENAACHEAMLAKSTLSACNIYLLLIFQVLTDVGMLGFKPRGQTFFRQDCFPIFKHIGNNV